VLFDDFNAELFENRLPKALITLQRKEGLGGFYAHQRFHKAEGGRIDEIALNPSIFGRTSIMFLASILVHEMVHMEQAYFGKPGDNGFHNAEWGRMMKRVGLHPSTTGRSGGGETGTRVSHYVIPGGAFERAAAQHPILKNERLAFYE
jgi:predicted SprT family Zn-dependent metalloprotease